MKKYIYKLFLFVFFSILLQEYLLMQSSSEDAASFVKSETFRAHQIEEKELEELLKLPADQRGAAVGTYLLTKHISLKNESDYLTYCNAIWKDVTYFPIPVSNTHKNYQVSYEDSWMTERTYGGKRGHEGVDIIASEDLPGLYPVLSMTDGTVTQKGWLEKGGWRIGILSPSGGYFYYAHLDSYNNELTIGDDVKAGEVLGFMGNSGYGPEGTTGMFTTHLHLGIYLYPEGEEVSINPYWILRMAEEKKLSCSF